MAVLHDCQNVHPDSQCRYDAAIICKQEQKLPVNKQFIKILPGGRFAKYRFSCPVAEYGNISTLINSHLRDEAKLEHAEGISYFRFQTLPCPGTADNLFIEWFIPIT